MKTLVFADGGLHATVHHTGSFHHRCGQGNAGPAPEPAGAVAQLFEKSGGKLLAYYVTFGEYDFLLMSEGPAEGVATSAIVAACVSHPALRDRLELIPVKMPHGNPDTLQAYLLTTRVTEVFMAKTRLGMIAAALACSAGIALAQGGPGGPGAGSGGAGPDTTPAPQQGPGARGPGGGPGMGPGMRWGPDVTPGWSMMTEQERAEHRQHMQSMTSYDECRTYMEQHRQEMDDRARERGGRAMDRPRQDACAGLKP